MKNSFSSGVIYVGECILVSRVMVVISSVLLVSDEKNCVVMMV